MVQNAGEEREGEGGGGGSGEGDHHIKMAGVLVLAFEDQNV